MFSEPVEEARIRADGGDEGHKLWGGLIAQICSFSTYVTL